MKALLTEAENEVFQRWDQQTHEFDNLHQHMKDEGANWTMAQTHDAVRRAENLDESLRGTEKTAMGLVKKYGRAVSDLIRDRAHSYERRADELARLARRQSDELESVARHIHSRRREEAARDVDDRARSLERDVQESANTLVRHVELQASYIEDRMRKDYSGAADRRMATLHRDRQAEEVMGTGSHEVAVELAAASSSGSGTLCIGIAAIFGASSLVLLAYRQGRLAAVRADVHESFLQV